MILVIRTQDKSKHYEAFKRGDVVEIVPDGWVFTPAELGNPDYLFVKLPLTETEAGALCGGENLPEDRPRGVRQRKRRFNFDLDLIPDKLKLAKTGELIDGADIVNEMRSLVKTKLPSI